MRPLGQLFVCREGDLAERVFLVVDGRRHWMPSKKHIESYGFSWPSDVTTVDQEVLRALRHSSPVARQRSGWASGISWRKSPATVREFAVSKLSGLGVEFGAGTHPIAVPLTCDVKYADFIPELDLRDRAYEAQGTDFVALDYVTSMEEMHGIDDQSLDFVLASHVIEHTRNPLLAIKNAFIKLKPGGHLVMFVPDMKLTFDKARDVTTLEHIILDFETPLKDRDALHYVEFFSRAFVTPIESLYPRVLDAIAFNYDIHFHTWTYESFGQMIGYATSTLSPWSNVWSAPAVEIEGANEFYFVLTR